MEIQNKIKYEYNSLNIILETMDVFIFDWCV